jgi:predicted MFS family arabinose efflux permease
MSQGGVALFALVGGAGAIAAPLAGRAADKGWTEPGTAFAILCVAVAVLITRLPPKDPLSEYPFWSRQRSCWISE